MNSEEEEDNQPRESLSPRQICLVVITMEHDSSRLVLFIVCQMILQNGPSSGGYFGKEGEINVAKMREEGAA